MGTTNRCTLAQLDNLDEKGVDALPIDQVKTLLEDAADMKAAYDKRRAKLDRTMATRFAELASDARRKAGKDAGTVRLEYGGGTIVADLPTTTSWDQSKLKSGLEVAATWPGYVESDYVTVSRVIPEAKFKAFIGPIKALFQDARTVKPGKQTFKFAEAA